MHEGVVHGHLTRLDLGVAVASKDRAELSRVDHALPIHVELVEDGVDDLAALLAGATTDAHQELLEVEQAVFVRIEVVEQDSGFALRDLAAEVAQAPVELLLVDQAVIVVVNHREDAVERADSRRLLGEVAAETIQDYSKSGATV